MEDAVHIIPHCVAASPNLPRGKVLLLRGVGGHILVALIGSLLKRLGDGVLKGLEDVAGQGGMVVEVLLEEIVFIKVLQNIESRLKELLTDDVL